MIDFHTHILPGIDDGSKSVAESLKLLQLEAEQGISEVVLTPHFYATQNSPYTFLKCRNESWQRLAPNLTSDLPRLRLGAEVQYYEGICAAKDLDILCIDGSNLLLLEMPFSTWTQRQLNDLCELNSRGNLKIILAHIERYLPMQKKNTLSQLLDEGVLIQSNVSFFIDWRTRLKASSMLEKNQIHIVGSDCHGTQLRPPKWEKLSWNLREKIERKSWIFSARYFDEPNSFPCNLHVGSDAEL